MFAGFNMFLQIRACDYPNVLVTGGLHGEKPFSFRVACLSTSACSLTSPDSSQGVGSSC